MNARLAAAVTMLVLATAVDLVAHGAALHALERPAHLAVLAGMVATLAAVITEGLQRHSRYKKGPRHAIR